MGVFEFFNRHRNKIMVAGGAVGAVMLINRALANYEKQWQTSTSKGLVHEAKRKEIYFENVVKECNQLCHTMSSKTIDRIKELMDDTHLIENIRQLKKGEQSQEQKIEAFEALRLNIFTRLLSELYCNCILVCYMRVQMSIIGADTYARDIEKTSQRNMLSPTLSKEDGISEVKTFTKYHGLLASFYEQRFDSLTRHLEEIVKQTLKQYEICQNISMQDIKEIFNKIKCDFNKFLVDPDSKAKVFNLNLENVSSKDLSSNSPHLGALSKKEEEVLKTLLAETQDILQSGDFKHVLDCSIDVGYAVLLDTIIFDAFIKLENNSIEDRQSSFQPNGIQVPMAKLMPQIRNNYAVRTEAHKKAMINHLLCLDVLNCFASNVYEAFSTPK